MIPKIIHYCWLSDGPLPPEFEAYINDWKRKLPDYEIRRWDFERFPKGKSKWVDQAFEARKFAFAADFIRAYALYNEGGIYLDSDVEVKRDFEPFLSLPYFIGLENGTGKVEAAVVGCEKGNQFMGQLLQHYDGREFVKEDGSFDMTPLPVIMSGIMDANYKVKHIDSVSDFDFDKNTISILPWDYFSPLNHNTRKIEDTKRTVTVHHFAASWVTGWANYRNVLKKLLGPAITEFYISLKHKLKSHT